jgi:hypothetical protein
MGFEKIMSSKESSSHKINSAVRFFENLKKEIEIAETLADIQDPLILKKFLEHLENLKKEISFFYKK